MSNDLSSTASKITIQLLWKGSASKLSFRMDKYEMWQHHGQHTTNIILSEKVCYWHLWATLRACDLHRNKIQTEILGWQALLSIWILVRIGEQSDRIHKKFPSGNIPWNYAYVTWVVSTLLCRRLRSLPEFRLFYISVDSGYVYFIYISVRHTRQIFHVSSLIKCPGHKVFESQNVKIIEI